MCASEKEGVYDNTTNMCITISLILSEERV